MKFKLWFEITLIVIMILLSIIMFLVPDMVACIICIINIFIFMLIDTFGTLIDRLNGEDNEED